jgi:hypothetical protein
MANPNILESLTVQGNNSLVSGTTTAQTLINNPASSGKIYKINSIVATNVAGNVDVDATVNIYSEDDLGGTAYTIAPAIPIPMESSLIIFDKTTAIYLKEDQSVGVISGGNDDLIFSASWDEIS